LRTKQKSGGQAIPPVSSAASGFRLEDFLPYQLSVTANRVSRLFAKHYSESFGLSIPEWRVLSVVSRFGTISPTSVSEWTGMDKVKVSRAAASLVHRGLARQVQDPLDGRARVLSLTRKGAKTHEGVVPLARKLEASLATGMSKADWTALHKVLQRLNAHVQAIEGPNPGSGPD
jgi:DNA-binding MarR family transcriptional regulator